MEAAGFPASFVGFVIALLVLLPETLAAVRAARRGLVQTSLNLALGSAMASIGLTVPVIALASVWIDGPLVLGLAPTQMVLLALTVVVGVLTVVPGWATRLQAPRTWSCWPPSCSSPSVPDGPRPQKAEVAPGVPWS